MKSIPFYALLIMTFGFAAFEKFTGGGVPEWFIKQFQPTIIGLFPGSLTAAFFGIALLELATFAVLVTGLARREFQPGKPRRFLEGGVILAQVTFIVLGLGQRITHQYDAAGSLFFYAALTFIAGRLDQAGRA